MGSVGSCTACMVCSRLCVVSIWAFNSRPQIRSCLPWWRVPRRSSSGANHLLPASPTQEASGLAKWPVAVSPLTCSNVKPHRAHSPLLPHLLLEAWKDLPTTSWFPSHSIFTSLWSLLLSGSRRCSPAQCAPVCNPYSLGLHFLMPAAGVHSVSPVSSSLQKNKKRPAVQTGGQRWESSVPLGKRWAHCLPRHHFCSPAAGTQEGQLRPQLWPCQSPVTDHTHTTTQALWRVGSLVSPVVSWKRNSWSSQVADFSILRHRAQRSSWVCLVS